MSEIVVTSPHTKWGRSIGIAVAAAVVVGVFVLAFIWPGMTSTIKDFPIAVTGDATQVTAFTDALDENAPGRFDVTPVDSRADAVTAIEERDVYGAVVLSDAPEVLTASAGGTVNATVMAQISAQLQQQVTSAVTAGVQDGIAQATAAQAAGQLPADQALAIIEKASAVTAPVVITTDVVPLADTDPRGVGFASAAFPMVIGGMIGGVLISLLVTGVWRRFAALATYAVVAGLGLTAIMQTWFGILQGDFLLNSVAVGLSLLATASVIVGATALIGRVGIAVGALLTMLIGNPLSAATQPMQFLPGAWGEIGQFFVPGASTTLLRDLSYFPDADATQAWLVLGGWAVAGIVLSFLGHFRSQEVVHVEGALEAPRTTGSLAAVSA
ncbi:ABC transporter permease [Orlajensenia leifsoniae]|uniref:ABC transporter permease n=1 Tax=Orlajensenia leifsoniae TaxID=2561933 RepID=A0A4Y9R7N8_9MICO|nr:ABC transporter permease [Leifsonia flava]TFV99713.1 ABC transporter permease [Leifsonia flava]